MLDPADLEQALKEALPKELELKFHNPDPDYPGTPYWSINIKNSGFIGIGKKAVAEVDVFGNLSVSEKDWLPQIRIVADEVGLGNIGD